MYLPHVILPEVILETQFHQHTKDRGKFYNEIMANIGLGNPTTSLENRGSEDTYQEPGNQLATTPIRNSAANLMALVTDHGFLYNDRVVWIKLEGIEGGNVGIACVYAPNIPTKRRHL